MNLDMLREQISESKQNNRVVILFVKAIEDLKGTMELTQEEQTYLRILKNVKESFEEVHIKLVVSQINRE